VPSSFAAASVHAELDAVTPAVVCGQPVIGLPIRTDCKQRNNFGLDQDLDCSSAAASLHCTPLYRLVLLSTSKIPTCPSHDSTTDFILFGEQPRIYEANFSQQYGLSGLRG
jgi:hypothetical protein